MPYPSSALLSTALVIAACGGDGSGGEPFGAIASMCTTLTECGVIAAADTDSCIRDLDAASPDSATRAADECATCFDTMSCGDLAQRKCATACAPFVQTVNSRPGMIELTLGSTTCTGTSTNNYARATERGVGAHFTFQASEYCDGAPTEWDLGAITVGQTRTCASAPQIMPNCSKLMGTFAMAANADGSWVTGNCACDAGSLGTVVTTFELPYRWFL